MARGKEERGQGIRAGTGFRPPYLWAFIAGAAVWLLYVVTLAPTTAFWDTSEYIATAHIVGVPHPPGNPLFVVLARAWEILLDPSGLPVAARINLFSATMSALAHGLWFLVVHRILTGFVEEKRGWFPIVGALAAVLLSATAFTVWNQSNVNEKVYTVSLFTIALLSWLVFHWRDNLGYGKDDNLLVLMVFILALSVGNHLMAFLAAPALVIYVLWVEPRTLWNPKLYAAAAVATVLGLSIHLFLPLRAGLEPVINEAAPTCRSVVGALQSIVTWGMTGCENLSEALQRQQYDKPPLIPRQAPFHSQIENYLQYFDWQWARSLGGSNPVFAAARLPFTLVFGALGLYGAVRHWKRDRPSAAYMTALFLTVSVALVFYLNFRYGYSLAPDVTDPGSHEVRERDYFFIVSFSLWGLWAGVGLAALWKRLATKLGGGGRMTAGGLRKASPLLAVAAVPLLLNASWASRSGDYAARDWAYNLLQSVEPYAVLFTNGDNDTFPLWYLQEVEGIRQDVTVIVISYLNTEWYASQLKRLTRPCPEGTAPSDHPTRIVCQRPYEPGPEPRVVYRHRPEGAAAGTEAEGVGAEEAAGPEPGETPVVIDARSPIDPPRRAIFSLDSASMREIAGRVYPVREALSFRAGEVTGTFRNGMVLVPWHQYAVDILRQTVGDRPVYFASTTNAYQEMGLGDYLIREGLAYRLHDGRVRGDPPPGVVRLPDSPLTPAIGDHLDIGKTRKLVWDVFMHRSGIPDEWDHWPDASTQGIPSYYSWTHYALGQAAAVRGDEPSVRRNMERAEAWIELSR